MWTKRAIIEGAYAELALAGWVFDLQPEEIADALRRLNLLMASWAAQGIRLPYEQALTPDADDPDDDSGLPLVATEAVMLTLAKRIAASKGKTLMPTTVTAQKEAFDGLLSMLAKGQLQEVQFKSGTPRGSGYKVSRTIIQRPFFSPDSSELRADPQDGGLLNLE